MQTGLQIENQGSGARAIARRSLFLSTCAIALGYAGAFFPSVATTWSPWLLALGIPAALCAIMALGAIRNDKGIGRLLLPLLFVYVVLTVGFSLALALPASESATSALWLGLPLRASIVVYGIGLLPIIVLPIAYAMTFDTQTLTQADLDTVRSLAVARTSKSQASTAANAE